MRGLVENKYNMMAMSNRTLNSNRFNDIDIVKGLLVICVVAGHYIMGGQTDTFLRHFIYSFHMPLFIGISGFLLKRSAVQKSTFGGFVRKYGKRMIIPWLIAYIVYVYIGAVLFNPSDPFGASSSRWLINNTQYLYYHLWYIPGLLSYLLYAWVTTKCKLPNWATWLLTIFIVIISASSVVEQTITSPNWLVGIIGSIKHNFRPSNLGFFMLGYTLGNRQTLPKFCKSKLWCAISIIPMLLYISTYFNWYNVNSTIIVGDPSWFLYQVANVALLFTVIAICTQNQLNIKSQFVSWLGRNSLPLYLWHIIIKVAFISFAKPDATLYYALVSVGFLILCVVVYFINKVPILSEIVCGNVRRER